jgi:hypothetical protein
MQIDAKSAGFRPPNRRFGAGGATKMARIGTPGTPSSCGATIKLGPWHRGLLHWHPKTPGNCQGWQQVVPAPQALVGGGTPWHPDSPLYMRAGVRKNIFGGRVRTRIGKNLRSGWQGCQSPRLSLRCSHLALASRGASRGAKGWQGCQPDHLHYQDHSTRGKGTKA